MGPDSYITDPIPTQQQPFTVDTITGNPANIRVSNQNSGFAEVQASFVNQVLINLTPVAITSSSDTGASTVSDSVSSLLPNLQNVVTQVQSQFAPSPIKQAHTKTALIKALKENPHTPFETTIETLLKEDSQPFVKFKGDYRVYAVPYMTVVRNSGAGGYKDGFSEKYYGMLFGTSHYLKKYKTNLHLLMGVGASKTQMERNAKSQTTGKNVLMGVSLTKTLWDRLEWDSSLHAMGFKKIQYRQGNPDPYTQYLAKARYYSYAFSFQNELGYVLKLKKGFSLKPSIGVQIGFSRRSKFSEENAGNFAQSYRPSIERGGRTLYRVGLT